MASILCDNNRGGRVTSHFSPTATIYQKQIAATLAALLGEDYASAQPKAGPVITDLLPKR